MVPAFTAPLPVLGTVLMFPFQLPCCPVWDMGPALQLLHTARVLPSLGLHHVPLPALHGGCWGCTVVGLSPPSSSEETAEGEV